MDLTATIISAENRYKQILEGFFISIYKERLLPSHGISHHRRVWQMAKELTLILAEDNNRGEFLHIPSLLIASYIHDLGMAVDHGPRHGRHSLEFCKRFLQENDLEESDFPGLFQAVLDHDNKEYSSPLGINIQTILSVADDLDAFGYTGIYRYTEIYTLRGIERMELGYHIRENALKRYLHFEELFRGYSRITSKHKNRFEILDTFFSEYNHRLKNGIKDYGQVRVINILAGMVKDKVDMGELLNAHEDDDDPVVRNFFKGIKSETIMLSENNSPVNNNSD